MALRRQPGTARLRRLIAATTISSLGDGMALVAFSLLALKLTSEAILIAGVAVASRLPWLIVALPAGAIVDKVDRRRLVLVVDLIRGVVLGVLALGALLHVLNLVELYVGAFLIGSGDTVVSAASRAAIPLIVEGERVPAANGKVNAAQTFGLRFAGPALGGFALSLANAIPFAGDAVSYLAAAVLLQRAIPATLHPVRASIAQVRADIRSGLRYFLATPLLRVMAGLVGSFAFCQAIVLAVLVIYSSRVLGLGQVGFGVILSVAAVGDVGASLLARRVHDRLGPYMTLLGAGCAAAAGYVLLGLTSQRVVAVLALALEAAATAIGNVASMSFRHRTIPTESFGIVNNSIVMCVAGLIPAGAIFGGVLASAYGTKTTFIIAGALQLAMSAVLAMPLRVHVRSALESIAAARNLATME